MINFNSSYDVLSVRQNREGTGFMQYDTFTVAKENTVKKLEYQMLETDTGIEIKIPMEEYNTKDNVEIIEEPGGGSTIIIKNIENVKIK